MSSPNRTPNKNVKLVELKWKNRADRFKSPKKRPKISPKKYNLRSKKNPPNLPKKPLDDAKQKSIQTYFSPKCKMNNNNIQKTPEKPTTLTSDDFYLSPSARFDSLVPKVEDILRARENEEKFKRVQEIISQSSKRFLEGLDDQTESLSPLTSTPIVSFKNCRHLSIPQITRKFKKDVKYIDDIFHGRVRNERYEQFKKDTPLNNGTKCDLRVNETNVAFTQDQLIHIISLFRERYDKGNMYKHSDFYFKVLLPEYCLKIYSDVYKMTPKDALEYLKSMPVQDFVV